MLYTLYLDENNYLLSIAHTQNDYFEIEDISSMDVHLNAYHLVDESLVLDEIKLAMIVAEEKAKEEEERRKQEEFVPVDDRLEALEESTLDISTNIGIENEISVADRLDAIEEALLELIGG